MEIIEVDIQDLKPYEHNPRNNDDAVAAVANSINAFGFKVPIIIDSDNVIVAGHTRLKAAMVLGLNKVPCIVADDLSEEQIKAFRLADNKVAELATWNFEDLEKELEELKDMDLDFDMSDFGFEPPEIGGVLSK
jgi:site-specific DNA-methyltransferase (adenine-specific)